MELRPCKITDIERYWYKPTKNQKLLSEFVESDSKCVEVVDYPHSSAKAAQVSFINSIKRYGFAGIRVMIRKEKVYLVKE